MAPNLVESSKKAQCLLLDTPLETPLDDTLDVFVLVRLGDADLFTTRFQFSFAYLEERGKAHRMRIVVLQRVDVCPPRRQRPQ